MNENVCQYCDNTGLITLENDGYGYTFKCTCKNGLNIKTNIPQWSGKICQIISHKNFTLHPAYRDRIVIAKTN